MANVVIKIDGLEKLRMALLTSPQIIANEINNGIRKAVFNLERTAKQLSPVDTGRLRASHVTEFAMMQGEMHPTTDYALPLHEGHRTRGGRGFVQGIPWITATANQERNKVEKIMQDAVNSALRKIAK